jgi:hypothetical protein
LQIGWLKFEIAEKITRMVQGHHHHDYAPQYINCYYSLPG